MTRVELDALFDRAGTNCGGCGSEMKPRSGRGPSLDRLDNSRGYTADNVVVMCMKCNVRKGDLSGAGLLRLAQFVLEQEALAGSPGGR